MSDEIEWKEAISGQEPSDSEENAISEDEYKSDWGDDDQDSEPAQQIDNQPSTEEYESPIIDIPSASNTVPVYKRVNLSFRRNITALADINQHKPRTTFDGQSEPFDKWMENALVAISPNADILLFASNSPEKMTFIAKLRLEPINQYITKPLNISLDYSEQITSLLCLPTMSTQRTAIGLVDWTALVVGLSSGHVKFYTEQSICLLVLRFCDEPVISLKCQTQKCNANARSDSHFPTIIDELLISYRTHSVIVDGLSLFEILRLSKQESLRSGSDHHPAYTMDNLPCILTSYKWKPDELSGDIMDADSLGIRRITAFDSLVSDSINLERLPTKACARNLAFVSKNPFISSCIEPKDLSTHTYTEIIGSIFSYWNKKPEPSRHQQTDINKPATISLYDRDRLATSIVSSPDKRLAAVTDDFGRILLLDATNMVIIRIWKGYRSAQCGWVEVQQNPELSDSARASFLVIYAPKRGLLEVWSAQRGPRVAAFNVGKSCTLLYCGYKMFNMRGEQLQKGTNLGRRLIDQAYSSNCYLLNHKSETIFAIDLPFTYSLYKYDDLKSRDRLLINELVAAIDGESDTEVISEILNRLVLAESIESSLQKIATSLSSDQIVPIIENLVVNIMKKYDNHSGETISVEDGSTLELCKRLIRLCKIFEDLSQSPLKELSLPDINQRLIDSYEEHPQEIDDFSDQLGWQASEVLRFSSLLSLERSYRKNHISNPWPSIGEPLTWLEFVSCFDLNRRQEVATDQKDGGSKDIRIRLREFNNLFLSQDKVMKTALFMYNKLSEDYYRSTLSKKSSESYSSKANSYNVLEASSRLALLFQFWLSTKLCNHWKMWAFLQTQVSRISDELKVCSMSQEDDSVLIDTWKQIYHLILESDNIFAGIIATATIKSDTIKMIQDDEKREKLSRENESEEDAGTSSVDWETLCIDAERMSLLSKQLEDVFLLNLLLNYSVKEARLVTDYMYRVPRISVANIIRGGPTIVSELVAQWAIQSEIRLSLFMQPYGEHKDSIENQPILISEPISEHNSQTIDYKDSKSRHIQSEVTSPDNEEHAKELIHHVKSSFPCSLEPNVILLNCIWELCRQWTSDKAILQVKSSLLERAFNGLSLISDVKLKHKIATVVYKAFFQRMFERLMILAETNGTIASAKFSKARDKIIRKELNIGDDYLDDFVKFICDLSEFMLQTCNNREAEPVSEQEQLDELDLHDRILALDDWWSTSQLDRKLADQHTIHIDPDGRSIGTGVTLVRTTLFNSKHIDINSLIELNRAATLMNLIFRLGIIKAYPITLVGEETRQLLHLDQQQPVSQSLDAQHKSALTGSQDKMQSGSLAELRRKFARKCIVSIVRKMTEDMGTFKACDEGSDSGDSYGDAKEEDSSSGRTSRPSDRRHSLNEDDSQGQFESDSSKSEAMILFADLLSLSREWQLNRDELHLELVFELYRCNLDKIGFQISTRVLDQQTLARGLLKIASQRVLLLFGLCPNFASEQKWHSRSDKWSIFQPNVASWLKSIQQEELRREIASLNFVDSLRHPESGAVRETFGVEIFVLHALRRRTKLLLDNITNHLDGQASRIAYDLLQVLDSHLFDKFLKTEIEQRQDAVEKSRSRKT